MGKKTMILILLAALLAAVLFIFLVPDVRLSSGRYPLEHREMNGS